jgi:adenine-specific DNA-methyltransferase
VREDEPLEKEVAVDPEMLGKVFENLLEVNDRKSKGAFYTPREIVHYMCQESLINYLYTALNEGSMTYEKLGENQLNMISNTGKTGQLDIHIAHEQPELISKDDIDLFIRVAEACSERDEVLENGEIKSEEFGLPESIRAHAKAIDRALADVKICDPAIGSGAFPVGMMNEIVRARGVLTPFIPNQTMRDAYSFKWHCIENSLYGVDIDLSAIEIAKLRLWLSLVVDEESYDQIRPLPNLDYRIVCGNSLQGIDIKDKFFQWKYIETLEKKKTQYFTTTSTKHKQLIRNEIKDLINQITNGESVFDFHIHFSEVFTSSNGFNIVAGNPPYLGVKGHKTTFDSLKRGNLYTFYLGQMDLFYFFFHLSLNILRPNGIAAFISTNYYLTATSAKKLRQDLKNRACILRLINFNELKIFESALGQHNIMTIFKKANDADVYSENLVTKRKGFLTADTLDKILSGSDKKTTYSHVLQNDLFDGQEHYIRLGGLSTNGDDPIISILNNMRQQGIELASICNVNVGLYTGADKVSKNYIQKYSLNLEIGKGIFVINNQELQRLNLNEFERTLISPFFKNSDIFRWYTKQKPKLFLINISYPDNKNIDFQNIPNIINHIRRFEKILRNRKSNDNGLRSVVASGYWWTFTIRQIDFGKPKIIAPQRSPKNTFGYNEIPWFASADVYFITALDSSISLKYVLSLLNSKLFYLWLYQRGKRKGEILELYKKPLSEIPIKKISEEDQQPFINLADEIIKTKRSDPASSIKGLEEKNDYLVYQLYGLTEEEIRMVEDNVPN